LLKRENPELKYDFIYIDASHVAVNVLEDAVLAWRLLKKNGVLIFDDYEWNAYSNPLLCPKVSIDAFLKVFKNQFKLRHKGYQVVVEKYNTDTKIKKTEKRRTETDLRIRSLISGIIKGYF
jgi:predicted O-methyltransferase YrrM